MVIYQSQYDCEQFGSKALWTRPLDEFLSTVQIDGVEVPRFTFISD